MPLNQFLVIHLIWKRIEVSIGTSPPVWTTNWKFHCLQVVPVEVSNKTKSRQQFSNDGRMVQNGGLHAERWPFQALCAHIVRYYWYALSRFLQLATTLVHGKRSIPSFGLKRCIQVFHEHCQLCVCLWFDVFVHLVCMHFACEWARVYAFAIWIWLREYTWISRLVADPMYASSRTFRHMWTLFLSR